MIKRVFTLLIMLMFLQINACAQKEISNEERKEELRKIISGEQKTDEGMRDVAVYNLMGPGHTKEDVLFILPYLTKDPDPYVRASVADVLGTIGDSSLVVPALKKAGDDSSPNVRLKAAKSLIIRKEERLAVPILLDLTRKNHITWFLWLHYDMIKEKEAKKLLYSGLWTIKKSNKYSESVLAFVSLALATIYDEPLSKKDLEIIKRALEDSNTAVAIIGELSHLAKKSSNCKACLKLLEQATKSSNEMISKFAKEQLLKLNKKYEK